MNKEDELARRIVELLDEGAATLGADQRKRLIVARNAALARYESASAPVLAGDFSRFTDRRGLGVRYVLPLAALVLGLLGIVYIHSGSTSSDIADIDAGLLTDELPLNAYLDQGFDSWLKRSAH